MCTACLYLNMCTVLKKEIGEKAAVNVGKIGKSFNYIVIASVALH
jgi:hypothetical protein